MSEEDQVGTIEGLSDQAIDDIYAGFEAQDEDNDLEAAYTSFVESQNEAILAGKFKEFFSSCKDANLKSASSSNKPLLIVAKAVAADVSELVKQDSAEIMALITNLKNNVVGMRLQIAGLVDEIKSSGVDTNDAHSLLKLRLEALADYWSYLCLLALYKLNGDDIEGHPIINRLLFLRHFLSRLKSLSNKMEQQLSSLLSLANRDEPASNSFMLQSNLLNEELDGDANGSDEEDPNLKKLVQQRVNRIMESGNSQALDKQQKQAMIRAIQAKKASGMTGDEKKKAALSKFRDKRTLESNLVREMQDEIEERPMATDRKANIGGVYDPMQEKRQKYEEQNFTRTVLTKVQKKAINKRVERLKQMQNPFDLTEIHQIGEMAAAKFGKSAKPTEPESKGKSVKQVGKNKPQAWPVNKDEEQYDSKRQHRLKRASKLHKKKGRK